MTDPTVPQNASLTQCNDFIDLIATQMLDAVHQCNKQTQIRHRSMRSILVSQTKLTMVATEAIIEPYIRARHNDKPRVEVSISDCVCAIVSTLSEGMRWQRKALFYLVNNRLISVSMSL